jgi:hypothetical protein
MISGARSHSAVGAPCFRFIDNNSFTVLSYARGYKLVAPTALNDFSTAF